MRPRTALLVIAGLLFAPAATPAAGGVDVSYANGQLRIRCTRAGLDEVLKQVGAATGMQIVLDDSVEGAVLTADIEAQPANLALERVLEGQGISYAMSLSPDGKGVTRLYIGREGGATNAARPGVPPGGAPIAGRTGRRTFPRLPFMSPPVASSAADDVDEVDNLGRPVFPLLASPAPPAEHPPAPVINQ